MRKTVCLLECSWRRWDWGRGAGRRTGRVAASAQPKPATMEVKIDNFTFGPPS